MRLPALAVVWIAATLSASACAERPGDDAERPSAPAVDSAGAAAGTLRFLGEALIPPGDASVPVGGLSSLAYRGDGLYDAISDGRGSRGPARYYTLHIDVRDPFAADAATIDATHELRDADGEPFAPSSYDFEGLVATDDELFVSSEGNAAAGVSPFVGRFDTNGTLRERLRLPDRYIPTDDGTSGVRNNAAFESLTLEPEGRFLFTGTESALAQDGPVATSSKGSRARLLRYDLAEPGAYTEYLYEVDPVHTAPQSPEALSVNGLVELLALSADSLLALERSFVADRGHSIKIFEVCLADADDISGIDGLAEADVAAIRKAEKRLIVDLADLGIRLDNLEGMTFGPILPNGEPSLLLISDDNFAPERQVTQVLAFAVEEGAIGRCDR